MMHTFLGEFYGSVYDEAYRHGLNKSKQIALRILQLKLVYKKGNQAH